MGRSCRSATASTGSFASTVSRLDSCERLAQGGGDTQRLGKHLDVEPAAGRERPSGFAELP